MYMGYMYNDIICFAMIAINPTLIVEMYNLYVLFNVCEQYLMSYYQHINSNYFTKI